MNDVTRYSFRVSMLIFGLTGLVSSQTRPPGCPSTQAVFPFVCMVPMPYAGALTLPTDQSLPRTASTIGPYLDSPQMVAHFGYNNTCSGPVTLPAGDSNFFFPHDAFVGQPTVFEPGVHYRAFVYELPQFTVFQPELTWFLDGNAGTAKNSNIMYCQNPTSLIWKGAWSATTFYYANDVVSDHGSRWLAISSGVNLGVTPVEGAYWTMLAAQGPQGLQGQQGPQGVQGPPGPAGPAGPATISTITVPSASSTSTASCGAQQVLISGGGTCTVPNTNSISGRLASSAPSANNSRTVLCSAGQATAVALCH